jgi:uncharacterized membrane protein (DUF485 family)
VYPARGLTVSERPGRRPVDLRRESCGQRSSLRRGVAAVADERRTAGSSPTDGPGAVQREILEHEPELEELMRRRFKVGAILTVVMLIVYFGFILAIAFAKDSLGELLTDGLSWGMVIGVVVVLATWAVTFVYVRWANRDYEPEVQRLRRG